MMLTRFIRSQLIIFLILTVLALLALGLFYLRLPSVAGIGQYQLKVELPAAGGLYRTANVTYRGATIGKVTGIEPTEKGEHQRQVQGPGGCHGECPFRDRGR